MSNFHKKAPVLGTLLSSFGVVALAYGCFPIETARRVEAQKPSPQQTVRSSTTGRAIANMEEAECLRRLRGTSTPFHRVEAGGVGIPIRLDGPIDGISIEFVGRREQHEILDCRLALALHAWAPSLRAAGIEKIRHLSIYRPGARVGRNGKRSGHATGLAIDARYFGTGDETLDVLEHWGDKTRGEAPCPTPRPNGLIRQLVCDASASDLFQVIVTPHHNDAHANHVHLELVPDVGWSWIR